MYDYAHCISDAVEGITHSLCTLEFEDHRPLYDWCLREIDLPNHPELTASLKERGLTAPTSVPQQIEFSRLNLDYTVMSKRKLMALVQDGLVAGWDDPRMPTLSGVRRRGFPPAALRMLCDRVGVTKQNSVIEFSVLEGCVREELDANAARRLAVIDPLKLVIDNLPADHAETLTFPNHPKNEAFGTRSVPFSRELWIEREDFMEVPPKGFHRLVPGGEVRLRGVGIVRCESLDKDADGNVTAVHCTLDADTRPGLAGADRKVKGTIHWVSAAHAVATEIRLYDRLFNVADPDDDSDGKTYRDHLNPDSKRVVQGWLEPAAADAAPETAYQFERLGFFVADRHDHAAGKPVFNRAVTLRDSWAKGAKN
jgi:glutaminyl-tRNA synthetase